MRNTQQKHASTISIDDTEFEHDRKKLYGEMVGFDNIPILSWQELYHARLVQFDLPLLSLSSDVEKPTLSAATLLTAKLKQSVIILLKANTVAE